TLIEPRQLHGRFLQITDMHPDPYYKAGLSVKKACHRKKPKKKKNRADYFGTPYSDCDSPFRLTNFTLDFLEKEWANEIDFVICKHDNDRKIPRTPSEIYDLNRAMTRRMEQIFTTKGIPVVPSLGNNDVWRPNSITSEYSSIWASFIPFPYHQVFQRGAYYSVEVIPNSLAVISLNTMYFYDSNHVVGGCNFLEPGDPGNLQLDWLEVQLELFRERGMQVWLSGHVPPSRGNYFSECYVRYVELSLRFQDTIVGHLYGHMNADHFFFLEADDLELDLPESSTSSHDDLSDQLLTDFANIPKASKIDLDGYAVINVSPPVVPNPYLPTFRVFAYNVTGAEDLSTGRRKLKKDRKPGHHRGRHGDKKKLCKQEPYKNSWKCHLNEAWHSDSDAPSRTNQLWSPLGYAQYYLLDMDKADKKHQPEFKLGYTTFDLEQIQWGENRTEYPIPLKKLPKSLRKGNRTQSRYTPYGMTDLTIGSWTSLARQLGDDTRKKLRRRFVSYMYMVV
ncbi:hypothetical protein K435DRAFT_641814, partial [Dendrothele bispora CBS 962.96]